VRQGQGQGQGQTLKVMERWVESTGRPGLSDPTSRDVVLAVGSVPYGRPSELTTRCCDPTVREPVIAAIATATGSSGAMS
jgi:hypothetical protein